MRISSYDFLSPMLKWSFSHGPHGKSAIVIRENWIFFTNCIFRKHNFFSVKRSFFFINRDFHNKLGSVDESNHFGNCLIVFLPKIQVYRRPSGNFYRKIMISRIIQINHQ